MQKNCLTCNNPFEASERELRRGNAKFCDLSCSSKWHGMVRAKNRKPNVSCSFCEKPFYKSPSKVAKSKYHFCNKEHKDLAQKDWIGVPEYWGAGNNYRKIAFSQKPMKCERCGYDEHPAGIVVHHKDRDRTNNSIENLEILCAICHNIEHYDGEVA